MLFVVDFRRCDRHRRRKTRRRRRLRVRRRRRRNIERRQDFDFSLFRSFSETHLKKFLDGLPPVDACRRSFRPRRRRRRRGRRRSFDVGDCDVTESIRVGFPEGLVGLC